MLMKLDWEIVVDEPVDVVFEAFTEEFWDIMSAGAATELRPQTHGPLSVGSTYIHVAEHRSGRRVESSVKVEAYEPNQYIELSWSSGEASHWHWRFAAAGLANFWYSPAWGEEGSRLQVRFAEDEGGTRIRANTEHRLAGALIPLSFIMRSPAHRRIKKKLLRFKEAVEGPGVAATNGSSR